MRLSFFLAMVNYSSQIRSSEHYAADEVAIISHLPIFKQDVDVAAIAACCNRKWNVLIGTDPFDVNDHIVLL